MKQNEIWKIVDLCPAYAVSNIGRVKRIKSGRGATIGRIRASTKRTDGYFRVCLFNKSFYKSFSVHQLVARAFLGIRPEGKEINHKNGVKADNRIENLEYCSRQENINHAVANHLMQCGEQNGMAKLTRKDVRKIRMIAKAGTAQRNIACDFNISQSNVNHIISHKIWGWLE